MKAKRVKNLSSPILTFKGREVVHVRFIDSYHTPEQAGARDKNRNPATTVKVIDLETQTEARLICPVVLVSTLEQHADYYVGRCFQVISPKGLRKGKEYRDVEIWEIEDPGEEKIDLAKGGASDAN